jgi:hypothetical protein
MGPHEDEGSGVAALLPTAAVTEATIASVATVPASVAAANMRFFTRPPYLVRGADVVWCGAEYREIRPSFQLSGTRRTL